MVDEVKILKLHQSKIKNLKKHNNLYYNNDSPIIDDSQYDKIKKELLELENKYPFLKKNESVRSIVGAKPLNKFKKIKHLKPMLSLSNAFKKVDMLDFQKKIINFLSLKNQTIELFS